MSRTIPCTPLDITHKNKMQRETCQMMSVVGPVAKHRTNHHFPWQGLCVLPPAESWMAASSSFRAVGGKVYCGTPQHFRKSIQPSSPPHIPGWPPPPPLPIGAQTGVLSPSPSTSRANLAGRWRLECDKSICPGLNLYANLK